MFRGSTLDDPSRGWCSDSSSLRDHREADRFGCGKQISSYLGLVPAEDFLLHRGDMLPQINHRAMGTFCHLGKALGCESTPTGPIRLDTAEPHSQLSRNRHFTQNARTGDSECKWLVTVS
jgi:hypothetical protein